MANISVVISSKYTNVLTCYLVSYMYTMQLNIIMVGKGCISGGRKGGGADGPRQCKLNNLELIIRYPVWGVRLWVIVSGWIFVLDSQATLKYIFLFYLSAKTFFFLKTEPGYIFNRVKTLLKIKLHLIVITWIVTIYHTIPVLLCLKSLQYNV